MKRYDAVILGAGAAGLYAAGIAARRGLSVLLLDHAANPGEKIRISGGGRCNFTNLRTRPETFLSGNPHFAKSALARHGAAEFVALVRRYGIAFHEKALGQLFCDGKATQIVDMLRSELAGADLRLGTGVDELEHVDGRFRLRLSDGKSVEADNLVVATGGKSIPKMGATGFGYRIASQFGIAVTETRPGLVPLTFGPDSLEWMAKLAGVSLPVTAGVIPNAAPRAAAAGDADAAPPRRAGRAARPAPQFEEAALFTHRGLSGPAVLQISSYWREGDQISLSLLADAADWLTARKREAPKRALSTILAERLPARLAQHLVQHLVTGPVVGGPAANPTPSRAPFAAGSASGSPARAAHPAGKAPLRQNPPATAGRAPGAAAEAGQIGQDTGGPIGALPDRMLEDICRQLSGWRLKPTGSEGYRTAEVTLGGVSTSELDARTMQAQKMPGLYFIGEVVDVTGWLGGYNFQWAWSSAHACAEALEPR